MTTIVEFAEAVSRAEYEHPEWRRGQRLFNVLFALEPELADKIRGSEIDPFYTDTNIHSFVWWVAENLEQ